jgi:hypothetical protein
MGAIWSPAAEDDHGVVNLMERLLDNNTQPNDEESEQKEPPSMSPVCAHCFPPLRDIQCGPIDPSQFISPDELYENRWTGYNTKEEEDHDMRILLHYLIKQIQIMKKYRDTTRELGCPNGMAWITYEYLFPKAIEILNQKSNKYRYLGYCRWVFMKPKAYISVDLIQ